VGNAVRRRDQELSGGEEFLVPVESIAEEAGRSSALLPRKGVRMTRRIWQVFRANPLEIPVALILLGLGFALSQSSGWSNVAGNVLVALGGILLSWTAATTFAGEQAVGELRARLDGVTRQLGTVSGQIGRAAAQADSGSADAHTSFAVISQSTGNLYGLVNEMQLILGEPFRTGELIDTAETLEGLARRLGDLTTRVSGETTVEAEELENLQLQLEAVQKELSQASSGATRIESANCPSCGQPATVNIRDFPGSSALSTCERCGTRFHTHRAGDGSLFTRAWGGGERDRGEELVVECPNCRSAVTMRVYEGEHGARSRFCLNCFSRLLIDIEAERVVDARQENPIDGAIDGQSGLKSIVRCSVCATRSIAFYKKDETVYAECETCDRLLRASERPTPVVQTT
jgi:hypothetical protein